MPVIKCKCCGGDITIAADKTFGTCEYCGSTMTLPKVDDDQRAAAFNRGNHFRRQGEFDKALAVYERIVAGDDTDAEAHWCCALCRFGIEYVEDPTTYEWLPTCHRASFDSFLEDVDYLAAVENSEGITKRQYQKDAAKIAEVQRGILATSQNEEPFDVFICYKESEDNGERTRDSILAQEIYYQLTEQGRRVFFSRITLEDKAGTEYEPYIFAALNSAKVMVVVGTTPEHFSAVWVKNEWSRFLALMRKDRKKLLLPCYRDMDPYDLPEQLSVLQSYDMSKIGFMQDLNRGISKVLDADKKPEPQQVRETVVVQQAAAGGTTADAQVQRGNMALEDHDWNKADSFFEEALNLNPQCAEAYIGKMLARDKKPGFDSWLALQKEKYQNVTTEWREACPKDTAHIKKMVDANVVEDFLDAKTIEQTYEYNRKYIAELPCRESQKEKQLKEIKDDRLLTRAQQYAAGNTKKQIDSAIAEIEAELDARISQARKLDAESIDNVKTSYAAFITTFADKKVEELNAAAIKQREERYQSAVTMMKNASDASSYENAKNALKAMHGYKDSAELAAKCQKAGNSASKKHKTIVGIVAAAAVVCIVAVIVVTKVIIPNSHYNAAVALMDSGKYEEAISAFEAMDGYKDSEVQIENCQAAIEDNNYDAAAALMENGDYEAAINAFEALDGYKDSGDQIIECKYLKALAFVDSGDYDSAIEMFEAMDGYKDSADQIEVCQNAMKDNQYADAVALMDREEYEAAITSFEALDGYKDSAEQIENCYIGIYGEETYNLIKNTQIGDTITYGTYEQDNNTSNGKEDIEWLVLDKDDTRMLVISRYALECQHYFTSFYNVTWENSTLRKWLNETFINEAFSTDEAAKIETTTVTADKNPKYNISAGNNTQDKLFLLSILEAEQYFDSDTDRWCRPTAYAEAKGPFVDSSKGTCAWWLRSTGNASYYAGNVDANGAIYYLGSDVNYDLICVRPAMWIDFGKTETISTESQSAVSDDNVNGNIQDDETNSAVLFSFLTELSENNYENGDELLAFLQQFINDEHRLTTEELSSELNGNFAGVVVMPGAITTTEYIKHFSLDNFLMSSGTNSDGEAGIYQEILSSFMVREDKKDTVDYEEGTGHKEFKHLGDDNLTDDPGETTKVYDCYFRICEGIYVVTDSVYDLPTDELQVGNITYVMISTDGPFSDIDEIRAWLKNNSQVSTNQ